MSPAAAAAPARAAPVRLARVERTAVAPGDGWLTPRERAVAAALRVPSRLADWRLGRWAAKQALLACAAREGHRARPADIEVLAQPGGAPAARIATAAGPLPASVSISHRDGVGFAAASLAALALGCDVERIEPRSDAFVADYFTPGERTRIARARGDRAALVMLLWSAKESALKALGEGLRLDTRVVEVDGELHRERAPGRAVPLRVRAPGRMFSGWAWIEEEIVTTLVADQAIEILAFG